MFLSLAAVTHLLEAARRDQTPSLAAAEASLEPRRPQHSLSFTLLLAVAYCFTKGSWERACETVLGNDQWMPGLLAGCSSVGQRWGGIQLEQITGWQGEASVIWGATSALADGVCCLSALFSLSWLLENLPHEVVLTGYYNHRHPFSFHHSIWLLFESSWSLSQHVWVKGRETP